jgi:hypothetical protein
MSLPEPPTTILVSELGGDIDVETARAWRRQLRFDVVRHPPGSVIRLLVDQTGYRPTSLTAHRVVRKVVPELLAAHGLSPALADLFTRAAIDVDANPAVRIEACAMVHHDAVKMADLDRVLGRPSQRFFSDRPHAQRWLAALQRSELAACRSDRARRPRSPGRTTTP